MSAISEGDITDTYALLTSGNAEMLKSGKKTQEQYEIDQYEIDAIFGKNYRWEKWKMHSAKLAKSERLQRVKRLLEDMKPHTTREIVQAANVCAVNSIISELRLNGVNVDCRARSGERGVYEYQMVAA